MALFFNASEVTPDDLIDYEGTIIESVTFDDTEVWHAFLGLWTGDSIAIDYYNNLRGFETSGTQLRFVMGTGGTVDDTGPWITDTAQYPFSSGNSLVGNYGIYTSSLGMRVRNSGDYSSWLSYMPGEGWENALVQTSDRNNSNAFFLEGDSLGRLRFGFSIFVDDPVYDYESSYGDYTTLE